jgi:hypothetical protein
MEGVPDFLRGRGWVAIGSIYSTGSQPGSMDEYMKSFLKRATAGWVAVVLERAGVLVINRSRPARVMLRSGWQAADAGPDERREWTVISVPHAAEAQV